jgi:DNA-binding MarR family transcriptional regulator
MLALNNEIGKLWHEINKQMHPRFRQAVRGFNLPVTTLILLRLIDEEPGITISDLARKSGIVKSHVSKMVEQLVHQGFLEKRSDPEDQRLLRVFPTQAAADTKAKLEQRVNEIWAELTVDMPASETASVTAGLRTMLAALERSAKRSMIE